MAKSKLTVKDKADIKLAQAMIRNIKKGYGANCEVLDYEEMPKHPHELNAPGRCPSCTAKEVLLWLEEHIKTIKGEY